MKTFGKLILMLLLSLALVGLSGCAEKEKATGEVQKKTEEVKEDAKNTENVAAATDPKEEEVHDFVLKNTKVVQISNISTRVKEQHPDLGPFFVIRGIDERGQKSELWIKDMKIYEMIDSN